MVAFALFGGFSICIVSFPLVNGQEVQGMFWESSMLKNPIEKYEDVLKQH